MAERAPTLPYLFDDGIQPRRHKAVRQTGRAQDIADAEQGRETRQGAVLRLLARFQNQHEHGATAQELFAFALQCGEHRWRDIAAFRPRLTDLLRRGLIEPYTPRLCHVTGATSRTWRVREVGSQEPR